MTEEKIRRGHRPLTPYEYAEKVSAARAAWVTEQHEALLRLANDVEATEAALLERVPQSERELAKQILEVVESARLKLLAPTRFELGEDLCDGEDAEPYLYAKTLFELRDGKLYLVARYMKDLEG